MSKLITVWGAPGAGKTTFAVKLAESIYERYVTTVIVVLADPETPMLDIVCGAEGDEKKSLGKVLACPEITAEKVIKNMYIRKEKPNLAILGYSGTDNRFTYPAYDATKAEALILKLMALSYIVIVDCTSGLHDTLSDVAMKFSDETFRIARPDLKSLSFMNSQLPLLPAPEYKREKHKLVIMNTEEPDASVEDIKHFLGNATIEIPYSKELKRQMAEGRMLEIFKDKRGRKAMGELVEGKVNGN